VIRKRSKPKKPISEKQRADGEKLREELRRFDLEKFDRALERAIRSKATLVNGALPLDVDGIGSYLLPLATLRAQIALH
jgi:hypothetical protein